MLWLKVYERQGFGDWVEDKVMPHCRSLKSLVSSNMLSSLSLLLSIVCFASE